jgi:hypothetical protein
MTTMDSIITIIPMAMTMTMGMDMDMAMDMAIIHGGMMAMAMGMDIMMVMTTMAMGPIMEEEEGIMMTTVDMAKTIITTIPMAMGEAIKDLDLEGFPKLQWHWRQGRILFYNHEWIHFLSLPPIRRQ